MEGSQAAGMSKARREEVDDVVIRFAGDSGDGIQITGSQFTLTTALAGNDLATFPDFPAEIRAPAGTTFGVSAFQIHFGSRDIKTAGDAPDVLVVLNPAALKVNLGDLVSGGMIIADTGAFTDRNLKKAGFDANPVDDGTLDGYQVVAVDITALTLEAVKPHGLSQKEAARCKNMWSLGLVYWIYDRDRDPSAAWLNQRFADRKEIADSNIAAINAGHAYGETMEVSAGKVHAYSVAPAKIAPGLYRTVTGIEALSWGIIAGAGFAGLRTTFAGYPITPASAILHTLSKMKQFDVTTFQAEDEIAAAGAAIGAAYAGNLGVTASSGPGIALKMEAIGLAISVELPLIIINVQRAGPSTGLPTKTEQSDLYQAVYGRNADAPLVVLAARSPSDSFDVAIEAVRLATQFMTPVMVLADGYIANASEPWKIPDVDAYDKFPVHFHTDVEGFHPFMRDEKTLARAWAIPGTPGLEHRIGGIEKSSTTGNISYDAENHQVMTDLRKEKIDGIAKFIPDQDVALGDDKGGIAVVGWGSTYGPINRAVQLLRTQKAKVSHIHLRHIWPLPPNLGDLLRGYDKILVPEMNTGQLTTVLRDQYLVPAESLSKVSGMPFKVTEIEDAIRDRLETKK
ncbi:MAG: 2-oxoacid:acceptor oxidoreductase subunit alpha [Rhodospirillaceae bacterium]|jgi:2-oxoglutarate/2-oxoacid ferredoxin oxidoreductase subunit alpha|nr:2-oxoacid:acceptor oxidoreductase subunit alpha [Rhodospirillaceae bacterium]MBT4117880.1 2-oxoacid:acceptor oxidoreductase subunit alpha [Rhodospirillaceae bacterium]MBT4671128.1 2-oxoacid:acceptor oxidoreductase subunit alpha [Rhodospirillaceae bacterium]MBT4750156.1 2-oxoacid:acceptor oxidoreductase subunit alpha [Rhodospirillaceae bacterium]MBT5839810.1 2-oxoacid:acceptor oxidoreductase subunit alpha [Rhodospirillaceae bacterium]